MGSPFTKLVAAGHADTPIADLVGLSPAALEGMTEAGANALVEALSIRTIADLGSNPAVAAAQALVSAASTPGFDAGPPPEWAARFASAPLEHYRTHPSRRFRLDFGPIHYRGRLDGTARVLLVGQDPAANELIAHRALVGASGQRVQGFLRKLGIVRSYVMVNTFLYGVFGQYDATLRAVSFEQPILDHRNGVLDRLIESNPVEVVISIGRAAREAVANWGPSDDVVVDTITHPGSPDAKIVAANWTAALDRLRPVVEPDPGAASDPTPYGEGFTDADHTPIPRADLPFGTPEFVGIGSHAERDGNTRIVVSSE